MASELRLRLVEVAGLAAGPRQGDEGLLPLAERRAAVAAGAGGAETEGRCHGEHGVADRWADRHGLVAVPVVVPHSRLGSVLEDGHHVGHHLDMALDAGGQPQEGARRGRVGRGRGGSRSAACRPSRAARRGGPGRAASRSGCATWSRAPWSPGGSAAGGAPGCPWARSGSCRPRGRGGRRRRWGSRAGAGTTTRPSRPGPRGSCSRSPRGTRSRRSGESSPREPPGWFRSVTPAMLRTTGAGLPGPVVPDG